MVLVEVLKTYNGTVRYSVHCCNKYLWFPAFRRSIIRLYMKTCNRYDMHIEMLGIQNYHGNLRDVIQNYFKTWYSIHYMCSCAWCRAKMLLNYWFSRNGEFKSTSRSKHGYLLWYVRRCKKSVVLILVVISWVLSLEHIFAYIIFYYFFFPW